MGINSAKIGIMINFIWLILLVGIFLVCLNTFTGSTFDTITKYLSMNNYKWFHYYSIGGTAAIIIFLIFLNFIGGIKKHLILDKPNYYFVPIIRGVSFMPVMLIIFFSLKHIQINNNAVVPLAQFTPINYMESNLTNRNNLPF